MSVRSRLALPSGPAWPDPKARDTTPRLESLRQERAVTRWGLCCALALAPACSQLDDRAIDLIKDEPLLVSGDIAGRNLAWISRQRGRLHRIGDDTRISMPASPPSRLVYRVRVPAKASLRFHHTIDSEFDDRPPVEFRIRVRDDDREVTAWTRLLDPIGDVEDRGWQAAQVDLSEFGGREVELSFETSGFDENPDESNRAFWGNPTLTTAPSKAPLVVVYLVDTLRADHTSPYGYERDTTPALARFAADGVVFDAAISHASWTKPSVASIFTSQLPGRHLAVQLRDPLEPRHVTLAEMLQAKGFTTGAAIANSVIYSYGNNFDQGFDFFVGLHDTQGHASKSVDADVVVDAALEWIDTRAGLPQFVYVHTMDPHVPYIPPAPFDRRFEPHPTEGHPGVDPRTDFHEPADRERLVAQYDGEIAYGDVEFGRFIDALKQNGSYDDALIIFVADHGEEFLDHGKWLHGRSVFEELVRVPLIIKFPGRRHAGSRIDQQVQTVDILPTVLQALDLPVPARPAIAGQPLQDVVAGGAPEPPAVSEISHRGIVALGMRTRRDKFIQRFGPEQDELYFDLVADPGEQHNEIDQNARRAGRLRAALLAAMVRDPYRRHLRFMGGDAYNIRLATTGWIDGVEPTGLGPSDGYEVRSNGRRLVVELARHRGEPREIAFSVRPLAVPVWLEGTRNGGALPSDRIFIGEEGRNPPEVPLLLPQSESEDATQGNVLVAPAFVRGGLHLWLSPIPGRELLDFDEATIEQLKALGYLGG